VDGKTPGVSEASKASLAFRNGTAVYFFCCESSGRMRL
jgi:hypothetical protein